MGDATTWRSSINALLLSTPWLYFRITRVPDRAMWAQLIGMEWLASLVLVTLSVGYQPRGYLLYALGYLAFITVYELGYLANDAIAIKYEAQPRMRWKRGFDTSSLIFAVSVRLIIFASILVLTPSFRTPSVLAGYGTLAVAMWVHNTVADSSTRILSFSILATCRFALPCLPALGGQLGPVLPVVLGSYVGPRFLSYVESKGLADIPGRKTPEYRLKMAATGSLLGLLTSALARDLRPALFSFYFLALHGTGLFGSYARRVLRPRTARHEL